MIRTFLLPVALALSACASAGPAPMEAAATKVIAPEMVVDRFQASLRAGKGDDALALLADDVLILEGRGAERSKAEYASHHLGSDMAFVQAVPTTITNRTVRVADGMAYVATEGRTTGTFKGWAIDKMSAETMVLRRSSSGWTIIHINWSSADPR